MPAAHQATRGWRRLCRSNGWGAGGTPMLTALSTKSRARHTLHCRLRKNDEQSVSRNNEVLRRGCFSREKPPFSRWAPQSSEGVGGNESSHPSQKHPETGSPGPPGTCLPSMQKKAHRAGGRGFPRMLSAALGRVPTPPTPFPWDPVHFLRGICDFWGTYIALDRQGRSTAVTMTTKKKKKQG